MSIDKKISQLNSGAPAQAGDEYVIARSGANYKLTGTNLLALVTSTANTFTADQAITGNLTLNGQGDVRFADSDSSNYVAFQAPATIASNVTWTLPGVDGSSGQVLSTDGSGVLSWASAGSGGGSPAYAWFIS